MYLSLSENTQGKDYVVGDIHGCFSVVEQALNLIDFDSERDRLISVGDLVDRGPENQLVAEWLEKPCNYAVMGNHEYMCLTGKGNECGWLTSMDRSAQQRITNHLQDLPVTIDITVPWGKVGVIHAQVPTAMQDWQEVVSMAQEMNIAELDLHESIWGRSRIRQQRDLPYDRIITGIDLILCGHTQTQTAQQIGNHLFIDTALYQGVTGYADVSKLTLVNVTDKKMHLFTVRDRVLDDLSHIAFKIE